MSSFNDFNLGLTKVNSSSKNNATNNSNDVEPRWTSKHLCTPGCVTGVLMGCSLRTVTCHCHF